jgi:hypothetical protein
LNSSLWQALVRYLQMPVTPFGMSKLHFLVTT